MAATKEEILDSIGEMTVLELSELLKEFEGKVTEVQDKKTTEIMEV